MIFSPNKLMALAATFATTAQAGGGIFIIQCAPMTVQRADPIVFPGQISPHVHAVAGGTNFGLTTSNEDARNSQETTCSFSIDRSQYWQPQLYHQDRDGKFELIKFLGINAYYLDRVCDYAPGRTNCDSAPKAKAPPRGLRMVTGDPFRKNYDHNIMEHRAQSYLCLDPPAPEGPKILQSPCKESRTQTFFPSCWNGRDLDSADHKSHMSFPVTGQYDSGVCPESHPIAVLPVFLEFFHNNRQIADGDFNKWVFAQGDSVGYGIHGDYLQGWTDQDALSRGMATCSDDGGLNNPNCSIKQSSINQSGADRAGQVISRKPEKPAVNEEIGLNGKLDKLPGNNPVFRRSSSAKMRL